MKRYIQYATIVLYLLSVLFEPITITANQLESELSHVQSQMQEAKRKKELAEMEIGSVSEVLKQIQVELETALAALKKVENQLAQVTEKIKETEKKLAAAEKRLQRRETILNKRLRDIYIHGKLNYLEVIMGAKNFTDFANRMEFLKRIVTADLELIGEIKKERELILVQKKELEMQRKKLADLEQKAQLQKDAVESKKQEQLIVLNRLQNEKALAEQSYAELQSASEAIKAKIQARQNQGVSGGQEVHGTGQFIWPAHGPITSPFGYRIHPIFGTQIYHSGMDIGIDTGTPVLAADSGVVVEAGWISGYGYTVIIDHGNGLSTLYAHNSEVAVSAGQNVQKGQVISYSGSTGYSTGPHLHFEVRVNGSPVDPMGYL